MSDELLEIVKEFFIFAHVSGIRPEMKNHYTIKDLASKLNIHHTTVSRALRNHPDISKKTRKLVLEAASRYNYIPNSFAKNLRNAESKTIVVLVPSIRNYFFSEILAVISDLAFHRGYSVMIYQSNEELDMEMKNLESIMENRVGGVIASVADIEKNEDKFLRLEKMKIPVVLFDRFYAHGSFSRIIVNNYKGAFDATEYLIKSGKSNIAFYRGQKNNPVFIERYRGYREALQKNRIPFNENLIFDGGIRIENGTALIHSIAKNDQTVDAILCVVDMVALGVITGCRELGIDIPGDIALIGFDNEPAGRIIRPALTTIAQPIERIGRKAFEFLLLKMHHAKEIPGDIELDMELIKRTSA
jgi:LacI family transcriptional regulator